MTRILEIQEGKPEDIELLQQFLNIAGSSLATFRYYSKRPLSVITNHLTTLLLLVDNKPVAYGHLDPEMDNVWLGIAVAEKFKGKGLGKEIMNLLIERAREKKCSGLSLSVDKKNSQAIRMYQQYGFTVDRELNADIYLMSLHFDYE